MAYHCYFMHIKIASQFLRFNDLRDFIFRTVSNLYKKLNKNMERSHLPCIQFSFLTNDMVHLLQLMNQQWYIIN